VDSLNHIGLIAAGVAFASGVLCLLMIPMLPFAFIALFIWAVARSTRPALTTNF